MTEATPQAESLDDIISGLLALQPTPQRDELLEVAEHVKHYFNQPAHEIPIVGIRPRLRRFELYFWFLRLPEAEIEQIIHAVTVLFEFGRHETTEIADTAIHAFDLATKSLDRPLLTRTA